MNKKQKFYTHKDWFREQMKDPEFVKALHEPDDDPFIEIAYQLVQLRNKCNLTQKELARKMRTSQQAVARMESPSYRGYSLQTLAKVARVCEKKIKFQFV